MTERSISTIGYEGATLSAFIAALKREKIDLLVDVRAIPFSRKPGFSKTPLSAALKEAGIGYVHLKALGNPEKGKKVVHGADWTYEKMYTAHLKTEDAVMALQQAAQLAQDHAICLLCFERDPADCHRQYVAAVLHELTGLAVRDLYVEERMMEDLFE